MVYIFSASTPQKKCSSLNTCLEEVVQKPEGIRKAIYSKLRANDGYFKAHRGKVFIALGLTNCHWQQMNQAIEEINAGKKARVEKEGDYLIFQLLK